MRRRGMRQYECVDGRRVMAQTKDEAIKMLGLTYTRGRWIVSEIGIQGGTI